MASGMIGKVHRRQPAGAESCSAPAGCDDAGERPRV